MPMLPRGLLFALGLGALVVACSANSGDNSVLGRLDATLGTGTGPDGSTTGGPGSDGSTTGGPGSDGSTTGGPGSDGGSTGMDGGTKPMDGGSTTGGGDGAVTPGDAGPGGDPTTGCGPREVCNNGLDDNCNGQVDENCPCLPGMSERCYIGAPRQAGVGVCVWGMSTCTGTGEFGTWSPCTGGGHPMPVDCSMHMDYRCDGTVDEGCGCTLGATRSCYSGPAGTSGVGSCHDGRQSCVRTPTGSDWAPCAGDVTPTPNVCDGVDRMCTGNPMTGCTCLMGTTRTCYSGPAGTQGVGVCHGGRQTCVASTSGMGATEWGTCTGEVTPSMDMCDGIDHACNGMPTAGCDCTAGATRGCYTGPASTRGRGICHDGTQTCVVSGATSMWSSTCAGQVTPLPADVCGDGLDDNCDGTVGGGCSGMIVCPGDQTVPAGSAVTLTAGGSGLHGYTWTIVSAPAGGASTAVWGPSPPTAATESFQPFIVGVYTIRVSALDTGGHTVSCMFNVTAASHGLRVQLTWNGTGDADLHLHNGNATAWFGAGDDCYYANRTTSWGATLDFDNTSANGPENTRIDTPAIGTDYTVAVHNYARCDGRIATIQIFCGTTTGTTPTATYNSSVLHGTDAGDCTANTFWRVARVRFTSPTTCTVTPINSYTASNNACSAY